MRLGAHLQEANRLPEGLGNKWYAGPHEEEAHMKAWQDVQNRSSSSATTKKKLGEIYHADGEEGLESTVA